MNSDQQSPPPMKSEPLESKADWSLEAEALIAKHRLADAQLRLRLPNGQCPPVGTPVSIRQTRQSFRFGCLLNGWGLCPSLAREEAFRRCFAEVFNYASVLFQWGRSLSQRRDYEPADGVTEREQRAAMVDWCRSNRIEVKGHPLVFFFQPGWVAERPAGEREALLWRRVRREVGDFAGRVGWWETVNESSWQERRSLEFNALASHDVFVRLGPLGVIEHTHRLVSEVDPSAKLILNESYPTEEFRRLLGEVLEAGIRVDAIGFQNHGLTSCPTARQLWELCDDWAGFGVPIHFTELMMPSCSAVGRPAMVYQMGVNAAHPTCQEGELRQAGEIEQTYTALFAHPAVEAITWWGLTDWMSCLDAAVGLLRTDMLPKPGYERLRRLVKQQWQTRTTAVCGPNGQVAFRGFLGDYEVQADTPQWTLRGVCQLAGRSAVQDVVLRPGGTAPEGI